MNTQYWQRLSAMFRVVKPWHFLIAAAICGAVAVYGLRTNNLEMVRLRDAVYQADKDNGDVQGTLTALQRYVTSHMNTRLSTGTSTVYPPIQLKYTYERLRDEAAKASSNESVYTDAQTHCEQTLPQGFSGSNRLECIQDYVTSHGVTPQTVPDSLYKFDFVSPVWSPDMAGWGIVATIVCLLVAVKWWILQLWTKHRLH